MVCEDLGPERIIRLLLSLKFVFRISLGTTDEIRLRLVLTLCDFCFDSYWLSSSGPSNHDLEDHGM